MKNRNKKSKVWNQLEKWAVCLGCTWVLRACDSLYAERTKSRWAMALPRPDLAAGPASPRCPRSCGTAMEFVVGGYPQKLVYQLLRATLACFLVGFLPRHDRFLQIHFSRSWVVPGKPCQSSLISMCGLVGLGEAIGRTAPISATSLEECLTHLCLPRVVIWPSTSPARTQGAILPARQTRNSAMCAGPQGIWCLPDSLSWVLWSLLAALQSTCVSIMQFSLQTCLSQLGSSALLCPHS